MNKRLKFAEEYLPVHPLMERRLELGYTQRELANLTGVSHGLISHYERFYTAPPDERKNILAKILNCPVEFLFPKYLNFFIDDEKSDSNYALDYSQGFKKSYENNLRFSYKENEEGILTERISEIKNALKLLTFRERKVLEMYFGLNGEDPHKFAKIGESMGISRSRVNQIYHKCLLKIKKFLKNSNAGNL